MREAGVIKRQGLSPTAKVAIGCVALVVMGVGAARGLSRWPYRDFYRERDTIAEDLESRGFARAEAAQTWELRNAIRERSVFVCDTFRALAGSDTDVAVVSLMAEVHGEVSGDLTFCGGVLVVASDAVIQGNLLVVDAFALTISGKVEGEVRGKWTRLQNHSGAAIGGLTLYPGAGTRIEPIPQEPSENEAE